MYSVADVWKYANVLVREKYWGDFEVISIECSAMLCELRGKASSNAC